MGQQDHGINNKLQEKDLYFVAVKLFLRDLDRLLITHDIFGAWDLPGGRIRKGEFDKPLEAVIKRKVVEELGPSVRYELGEPKIFFRVERQEHDLNNQTVRIFAVGYEARYLGGEIEIGEHHDRMEWVDVNDFRPEQYFKGGWLTGLQEYLSK
ncbi:MAG TPA: NUDIX domain-containing protein [Candidatus Saccharimonadales bacterium]|nr:NUDIX domain-containing protein [Candidatus Saccharimonadales bacterium]